RAGGDRRERQLAEHEIIHDLVELQIRGRRPGELHGAEDRGAPGATCKFQMFHPSSFDRRASSCTPPNLVKILEPIALVQRGRKIMPWIACFAAAASLALILPAHGADLRAQIEQY